MSMPAQDTTPVTGQVLVNHVYQILGIDQRKVPFDKPATPVVGAVANGPEVRARYTNAVILGVENSWAVSVGVAQTGEKDLSAIVASSKSAAPHVRGLFEQSELWKNALFVVRKDGRIVAPTRRFRDVIEPFFEETLPGAIADEVEDGLLYNRQYAIEVAAAVRRVLQPF